MRSRIADSGKLTSAEMGKMDPGSPESKQAQLAGLKAALPKAEEMERNAQAALDLVRDGSAEIDEEILKVAREYLVQKEILLERIAQLENELK